jgi:ligand-binding sensor domain-containing protein/serine phosphatase RsbU (regulator of sigma subunit)
MQFRKRFAHTIFRSCFWLILISLSTPALQAQKIALENHTLKTGLPQNTVNDIVQDDLGFIWFATQVGAVRYDGYDYEYFNEATGLPDDYVNCLFVDSKGKIWFGTQGGIGVYNGEKVYTIDEDSGLIDNWVNGMIEDRDGNIWAWTPYGISVITSDSIFNYDRNSGLTGDVILDALVDSRGRVHMVTHKKQGITIFTDPRSPEKLVDGDEIFRAILEVGPDEIWYASQESGILVCKEEIKYRLGQTEGLSDSIVLCLMKDQYDRVWCSTYQDGLFVYENGMFRQVPGDGSENPIAQELIEDRQGRIWLRGFQDGVWMLDDDRFKHITVANNLVHDDVGTIFEDKFGSIWIGTQGGASKYGKAIFEIFDLDTGLPNNSIQSVFTDSRGRIWFGAQNNLLYFQGGKVFSLNEKDGYKKEAQPLSFAEDSEHSIYIGTDVGLMRYNGRTVDTIDLDNTKTLDNTINGLLYTSNKKLWCATDSAIYILDNGIVSNTLGVSEGLVDPQVNNLLQADSQVYCATAGGISVFDLYGGHIRNYTEADGLASSVCIDIVSDPNGAVWIATKSRGISQISSGASGTVVNYGTDQGLVSNSTYFVEFADSVSLWIGTNLGINVLNIESGEISFYGYNEGFYPIETNARAISKGEGGQLWIGTVEGLVQYDPRYDIKHHEPPALFLYPPLVNGVEYSLLEDDGPESRGKYSGEVYFPYRQNSLEFNFTGIHTTIPSRNTFSWLLEGFDEDWSEPGTSRSAPYPRLPNGHYIFRVKAYNLDGVEVENEANFAFTIKPPIWKTFWFVILEVLAGLALIYGVFKYRERQLIREKRILEHKVKLRTREIEDQKVEIEAQRDEISEQKSYVEEQRDQIAFQNKEITDSILYAKRIQQAVLPGKRTLEKTLPEHFILFKPRDIVSGDFFWVEKSEERIIVCAADCTGHGVPGAFMSLLGLTFLNEIVNHDGILKASRILDRLRTNIIRSMSHKDEDNQARDGMDVALVVIDPQLDILEFAGAYNQLVIFRNGELIEYKADKMPVGKHVGEEGPFTNHKIQLENGDMIYLYTDGFPDQFGGEKGSKYKARPFKRLLTRISGEPAKTQLSLLEMELKTWMGREEQVDDILVMGIRYLK